MRRAPIVHRVVRTAFAGLLALAPTGQAGAQATGPLAEAEAALIAADVALRDAGDGAGRLAALGQAVRAQELVLAAHRDALRRLGERAISLSAGIEMNRARIGTLVAALQSLTTAPRSAMFAYPGGPLRAARAETLLAAITPALEQRRIRLAAELERLRALRLEQDIARLGATGALEALQQLRVQTAIAIDDRRASLPPARLMHAQADRARALAASIGALGEALADLIPPADGTGTTPENGFLSRRGRLIPPVVGRMSAAFGDPDPWGAPGAGIVLTAPALAEVSSPAAGTIRFAGPLEGYGQVVILEPAPDWLITLAGLAASDREIGEIVAEGERLGALWAPINDRATYGAADAPVETVASSGANDATGSHALRATAENLLAHGGSGDLITDREIYIELRREGVPINPAPWFAGLE
ncbi:MAG: peptidoglycan DD-metalloendopeptidase family protein [Pseudomonadota bacterium]